jgi:hypothetical protein
LKHKVQALDTDLYEIDLWVDECVRIIDESDIFKDLDNNLSVELIFAEISLF